ncbi:MAG: hypothetical protein KC423_09375 [Anaerolineales bacterium]|nr:hypothetical protein [Anaerolineales bacterium]
MINGRFPTPTQPARSYHEAGIKAWKNGRFLTNSYKLTPKQPNLTL